MSSREVLGTTIIAMKCLGGAVVASDSRLSLSDFIVRDDTKKVFQITKNTICATSGIANINSAMVRVLIDQVEQGNIISTPEVLASVALDVYLGLFEQEGVCSAIICGWDNERESIQIYRVRLEKDMGIVIEETCEPIDAATGGSGQKWAEQMIATYSENMSPNVAASLAILGLCHASFFDKFTGGDMQVFQVTKDGYFTIYKKDSLRMYRDYFHHKANKHVIFLLYPRRCEGMDQGTFEDMIRGILGCRIITAHCVCVKKHFWFHRLLLLNESDVQKVMGKVKLLGAMPQNGEDGNGHINEFRYGFNAYSSEASVYVLTKSEENLDIIMSMEDHVWPPELATQEEEEDYASNRAEPSLG